MEEKTVSCPVCRAKAHSYADYTRNLVTYRCPVCGKYQLGAYCQERNHFNMNHFAAFLAHNAYDSSDDCELRYYTTVSKEICSGGDEFQQYGEAKRGYSSGDTRSRILCYFY